MVGFASRVTFKTPLTLLIRLGSIKFEEAKDSASALHLRAGEKLREATPAVNKVRRVILTSTSWHLTLRISTVQ